MRSSLHQHALDLPAGCARIRQMVQDPIGQNAVERFALERRMSAIGYEERGVVTQSLRVCGLNSLPDQSLRNVESSNPDSPSCPVKTASSIGAAHIQKI